MLHLDRNRIPSRNNMADTSIRNCEESGGTHGLCGNQSRERPCIKAAATLRIFLRIEVTPVAVSC